MMSSNGNIFCITGYLCREFTGDRCISRTKASDAELWCVSLICTWMNNWVNNREAGNLRHHCAHHDITVMWPVHSPHKGQWCGALVFSLICTWMNNWVNNREAGNLRHHCAHHDITVMWPVHSPHKGQWRGALVFSLGGGNGGEWITVSVCVWGGGVWGVWGGLFY